MDQDVNAKNKQQPNRDGCYGQTGRHVAISSHVMTCSTEGCNELTVIIAFVENPLVSEFPYWMQYVCEQCARERDDQALLIAHDRLRTAQAAVALRQQFHGLFDGLTGEKI